MYSRLLTLLIGKKSFPHFDLLKMGAHTAAFKVGSQLVIIASGILVARFLGPEQYGVYTFAMAIAGIFMLMAQLGFTTYAVRQISIYRTQRQWLVLRSFLLYALRFVFIGSLLITISAYLIIGNFSSYQYNEVLIWALFLVPLSAMLRMSQSFLVGFELARQSEFVVLFRQVTFSLLCLTILYFNRGMFEPTIVLLFQGMATLLAVLVAWNYLRIKSPVELRASNGYLRSENWLAGALSFMMLSTMNYLNTQTDIVMLGFFRESSELAFYRVASQAATLIGFGLQIVVLMVAPRITRYYAEKNMRELQNLVTIATRLNLVFAFTLLIILFAFSTQFIDFLFGSVYRSAQLPMYVLGIGKLLVAMVGIAALLLNMCGFEKTTTRILFYTAFANVCLNLVLVPALGALGASIATSLVVVVSSYIMFLKVRRFIGISAFAFASSSKE